MGKAGALLVEAGRARHRRRRSKVGAKDIRELFGKLAEQHPGLEPMIDRGIAVTIDGAIYRRYVVEDAA
jgi:molybdopterin synthase sulfur carrier subunit